MNSAAGRSATPRAAFKARSLLAGMCLALACLLVSSSVASAAVTHELLSSFGSFSRVQGVALDESTGDVYVYDADAGAIYKFDSTGTPADFSALGTNTIEGVGNAGEGEGQLAVDNSAGPAHGDIYIANGSHVGIYGTDGKVLGELSEAAGVPWGVPCGVAVDPTGAVYVGLNPEHVNRYVPAANPVVSANYTSSLWGLSGACNVAVDGEGSAYIDAYSDGPVTRYEALQFNALETPAVGSEIPGGGRTLAADASSNDLFVGRNSEVAQLDSTGTALDSFNAPAPNAFGNVRGVAVDGASGNVYVADNQHARVDVFGPTVVVPDVATEAASGLTTTAATLSGSVNPVGTSTTNCEFEYGKSSSYGSSVPCTTLPGSGNTPEPVTASVTGLEPNTTYHYRLASANANGTNHSADQQFTTLSPPIVERTWAADVGVSTATVAADLDTKGFEATYRFEYGTDMGYGKSAPVPDGDLGTSARTVMQRLSDLAAATTYHYRVVATSVNGTTDGPDGTFTTSSAPTEATADGCPNSTYRAGGPSANLPDCRAYEMISPLDKNGGDIDGDGNTVLAAVDGSRVTYASRVGFGDTSGSGGVAMVQYLATRGRDSWSTHAITPTPARNAGQVFVGGTYSWAFSPQLDHAVTEGYDLPGAAGGAAPHEANLYYEDTASEALQPITTPLGEEQPSLWSLLFTLRGYSADLGVVTFETKANLLPQASGSQPKLYAWHRGTLELAGILPDGSIPSEGSFSDLTSEVQDRHEALEWDDTVSRDGSRILFYSRGAGGAAQLYMRKNGTSTAWVSQSEASTPDPEPQEVTFQGATPDGMKVLFTTPDRLLDSDPGGASLGLYLYTDSPDPTTEANLTFIARINTSGEPVEQMVPGMSDDATRIYFFSGPTAALANEGVYLWDHGNIHFTESVRPQRETTRVSADGTRLAFLSDRALTPQGTVANGGAYPKAMYVYDAHDKTLDCASCPQSGAAITSEVELKAFATTAAAIVSLPLRKHFMSEDGRYVFFSTADALVPQDTNHLYDVYEYDTETKQIALLSSGTGEAGAWFADASANGNDVFLLTRQTLTARDTDTLVDLYDARVNGGQPEPPPSAVPCAGDACQGVPSAAPSFTTASGFNGIGNAASKPAATAKKKKRAGRKATKAKRRRHRKHTKAAGRRGPGAGRQGSGRTGRQAIGRGR